jgi:hypothetical protein
LSDVFKDLDSFIIKNKDLIYFFENSAVMQLAFNSGGWIAGGFPREIFNLERPSSSLEVDKIDFAQVQENYLSRGGDIDFFFKDEQTAIELQENEQIKKSFFAGPFNFALTGYEFETQTASKKLEYITVCVQLVNKFFYNNIEETFRGFDFYNSCYAIHKVKEEYVLTYLKKAVELDQVNTLKINHVNSPYTISRIVKYMKRKNIDKIEDESIQKIVDLVYKLGFDSFNEKYNHNNFKDFFFPYLKYAFEKLPLDPGIALIFLNRFKITDSNPEEPYGPTITVDWALKVVRDCVSTS